MDEFIEFGFGFNILFSLQYSYTQRHSLYHVASWLSGRALGLKLGGPEFKSWRFLVHFLRIQNK